jgi:hypothetical protein
VPSSIRKRVSVCVQAKGCPASSRHRFALVEWSFCRLLSCNAVGGARGRRSPTGAPPRQCRRRSCCRTLRQAVEVGLIRRPRLKARRDAFADALRGLGRPAPVGWARHDPNLERPRRIHPRAAPRRDKATRLIALSPVLVQKGRPGMNDSPEHVHSASCEGGDGLAVRFALASFAVTEGAAALNHAGTRTPELRPGRLNAERDGMQTITPAHARLSASRFRMVAPPGCLKALCVCD